jgi:Flp pilus assembly protein TadG
MERPVPEVRRRGRKHEPEAGVAVVEGAMTLLLFMVCLFGIMESARFINVKQALSHAAREGARLAVAPLSQTSTLASQSEIESRVQRFLNAASITGATVQIERPVGSGGGQSTRVRVSIPYQVISLSMFGALSTTLEGEAVMRNETSP